MKYDLKLSTIIDLRSVGKTLLEAISERFSYHTEASWLERIENGLVTINNSKASFDQILNENDLLNFTIPDFEEPDIDTDYETIWRNEYLLLVNKPAGLPVHSNKRFFYQTLISEIRRRENCSDINPLQRLDRETSGLMFLSIASKVPKRFHKKFQNYLHGKYYLAVIRGRIDWQHKTVSEPLKESLLPPVRYKMMVSPDGKPSLTDFYCLGTNDEFSILVVKLSTGRKHQIRAHLEHLGLSLVGEKLYYQDGLYFVKRCQDNLSNEDWEEIGSQNQLLHAYAISTNLPGEEVRIFYANRISREFMTKLNGVPNWEKAAQTLINKINGETQ